MLRATSYSRYAVKLKNNLPRGQEPVPVLPRSFASTARLCEALIRDCEHFKNSTAILAPWQHVRCMQIVSIHNLLAQLARKVGVEQIERFFEKNWSPRGPMGRTMGRGRAGKRGQNLPTNRSLATLEDRLALLYEGRRWPLQVDCYQLLWISLLFERPILGSAEGLLAAHHANGEFKGFPNILAMGLPILADGSTWKFDLWVGTQHASLPYLAGCVVLLRVCAEKGQFVIAYQIAEVLCRLLAMLGPELQDRGIGASMLRYCTEYILPIGGVRTTPDRIAHASAMLNLSALAPWTDDGCEVEWKTRVQVMSEILWGNFDTRLQQLCDPLVPAMPRQIIAKWTHLLRESPITYKGNRTADGYRDRAIDMPKLLAQVPDIAVWLRSDPRLGMKRRSDFARKSSWCAGLSGATMSSSDHASSWKSTAIGRQPSG